jgi:hypothetical protein
LVKGKGKCTFVEKDLERQYRDIIETIVIEEGQTPCVRLDEKGCGMRGGGKDMVGKGIDPYSLGSKLGGEEVKG